LEAVRLTTEFRVEGLWGSAGGVDEVVEFADIGFEAGVNAVDVAVGVAADVDADDSEAPVFELIAGTGEIPTFPTKQVSQIGTQTSDRSRTHHGLASPPRFSPTASVATPMKPSLHLQCTQATETTNTRNLLFTSSSLQENRRLSSLARRVVTRE
jgi:hypothetical protein